MAKTTRYDTVEDMLRALTPSYPVMCLRPAVLRAAAKRFLDRFPGRVLYAVKCNPLPLVLSALHEAGVRHFDTASLPEIALVNELFDDVTCYFHHPVKSRAAIRNAYQVYGVRDFVVDDAAELEKVAAETRARDVVATVRFATPPGHAAFDLSAKFGAQPAEAVALLRQVADLGLTPGLAFHVGSQCRSPEAFDVALRLAATILDDAAVPVRYLNVGGGFPADYPGFGAEPLAHFFETIEAGVKRLELPESCELQCEPGRALVADGCSLVVQVHLRKADRLYINDGIYGTLSDLHYTPGLTPPVRLVRINGAPPANEHEDFTLYGPTCDSIDVLPQPFSLPADVREGDWIEMGQLGAYSSALATDFNGLALKTLVEVGDVPFDNPLPLAGGAENRRPGGAA